MSSRRALGTGVPAYVLVVAALLLRSAGGLVAAPIDTRRSTFSKPSGGASRPPEVEANLVTYGRKYWCVECNCGFDKMKNWESHVGGRRHAAQVAAGARAAAEFAAAAPSWAAAFADAEEAAAAVAPAWHATADLATLPLRRSARMLDPSAAVEDLAPRARARVWRYCRDAAFGDRDATAPRGYKRRGGASPREGDAAEQRAREARGRALAAALVAVDARAPRLLRVKELLESVEAYKVVERAIELAERAPRADGAAPGGGGARALARPAAAIETIYDLACGHGFVGLLLALRYPAKRVVCVDLEHRAAHDTARAALAAAAADEPDLALAGPPLANLDFDEGCLTRVAPRLDARALVLAVHACGDANDHVVGMARAAGAAWCVMPCCVAGRGGGAAGAMRLDDDARYAVLCGAMASEHRAQLVTQIDAKITARPIVLLGGLADDDGGPSDDGGPRTGPQDAARPLHPRRLPPLSTIPPSRRGHRV